MAKNRALNKAAKAKEDEFYTQISDIERELGHYQEFFRGKSVLCNCDDPEESHFWKYFVLNFEFLGLRKLTATHFESEKPSYKLELIADIDGDGHINGKDIVKTPLAQNGDFRSPECVELMKEADVIVTNPPFSLFREYVALLIDLKKKFLIIGSQNNVTYKEIFPLIKENNIRLGYHSGNMSFIVPDYYEPRATGFRIDANGRKWQSVGNICWYTNIDIKKRHENIILFRHYKGHENDYPKYDNYDAIEVRKVSEIPADYSGIMGVPITFLDKYNPDQFEIVGLDRYTIPSEALVGGRAAINGKPKYARILIKNKHPEETEK